MGIRCIEGLDLEGCTTWRFGGVASLKHLDGEIKTFETLSLSSVITFSRSLCSNVPPLRDPGGKLEALTCKHMIVQHCLLGR